MNSQIAAHFKKDLDNALVDWVPWAAAPPLAFEWLRLRPSKFDLVKDVDDRSFDSSEDASSFATVTRCTEYGGGETTDEQTEYDRLPKTLRHTPSKSLTGRLIWRAPSS
ncbi:MAG: hypothetical protein QOC81_3348 [Thermoanaerobaculia bacterium]|nr:hypothetical protein [Thermoanaerobaculia bacterium]